MKTVFTQGGIVIGHGTGQQVVSGVASIDYVVPDNSQVDVGWTVAMVSGQPAFTAPASMLPMLTPVQFYTSFTAQEMIAIKGSSDPLVKEFFARYQIALQVNEPIDPNLVSVQEGLAYLAAPVSPGPGAGILASTTRIAQILAGTPQ